MANINSVKTSIEMLEKKRQKTVRTDEINQTEYAVQKEADVMNSLAAGCQSFYRKIYEQFYGVQDGHYPL